jgi:hypothetical protein
MQAPTRTRLVLAFYVDALLFMVAWPSLEWWLQRHGLSQVGWVLALLSFAALELLLLWRVGSTPGRATLGIARQADRTLVVAASHGRDCWWTQLLGVLGLLEGVKEVGRWTSGLPPPPFMGLALSWDAAAAVVTVSGLLTVTASLGVLRCRPRFALLGLAVTLLTLASWLLSWEQVPSWVEARTVASRALHGLRVKPGELETMRIVLPGGAIFGSVVGSVWLWRAWLRLR